MEREGWRFDIGGHRFFTKVREVDELWHEILGPEDFLLRPRLSRIYYNGTYFDYPIQIGNALRGLGLIESIRCGMSFLWVRLHPPKNLDSFEGWTAACFRLAALPEVLQDLHREGLGDPGEARSRRTGRRSGSRA